MRPLTGKQQRFVKEYLKDWNGARSVRVAYPNIKTEGAVRVMASKLVSNGNVKEQIEAYCLEEGLTPGVVMKEFQTIAKNAKYDRDKISSWRNIAEMAGFLKKEPSVIVGQNQNFDINETIRKLRASNPIDCTVEKIEQGEINTQTS